MDAVLLIYSKSHSYQIYDAFILLKHFCNVADPQGTQVVVWEVEDAQMTFSLLIKRVFNFKENVKKEKYYI